MNKNAAQIDEAFFDNVDYIVNKRYTNYYVKHIDCYGDEREEILVFDEHGLYIYTNAAFREKVELYNDTLYNGRK